MPEILSIINCLHKYFSRNFATFVIIIQTMLSMSGSKTMLNLSRWSGLGYRTLERFYERSIPWLEINLLLLMNFVSTHEFILASDETVVNKSGKKTHGLDYFFSSILKKPIKSLCFSGLSLIVPDKKKSYPLLLSQQVFTPQEKKELKLQKTKARKKGQAGRPKGSKNNKQDKPLTPTFRLFREQLKSLQCLLKLTLKYFVGDGKYGNNNCVKICQEFGYFLVSKLQYNSALYFEYTEIQKKKGRRRKYGERVDFANLTSQYLVKEEKIEDETTKIYQMKSLLNRSFGQKLNVVIIQKITPKKVAHAILFTTDLTLDYQRIIDIYSARFQIEFNFRDAKQFWGLEDFMNIKEIRIHNAANLAFFMVNFSNILLEKFRGMHRNSKSGIRDLMASYRAEMYYQETLKLLQKFNPDILIPQKNDMITSIGHIHA